MNQQNVHWFPGHMKKAWRQIIEKLPLVDVLIEVRDARAPQASELPPFPLKKRQTHLIVFNKADLAFPVAAIPASSDETRVARISLASPTGWKTLSTLLEQLQRQYHQRDRDKGRKPQPLKLMIVGVPNVGKSTLINRLCGQRKVATENRAGSTRGQQWIHTLLGYSLLDTPGVLTPRYEQQETAYQLAAIGSMKFSILPQEVLGRFVFENVKKSTVFFDFFADFPQEEYASFLQAFAEKRGMKQQGEWNVSLAEETFLHLFASGKLGRFTFV
jgi:ribosome biogenesis GTPase A